MFRIISTPSTSALPARTRLEQSAIEDILMDDDMNGGEAGPSRAQAVGGGRVTGPGEMIADAGKWMR